MGVISISSYADTCVFNYIYEGGLNLIMISVPIYVATQHIVKRGLCGELIPLLCF